jgi:hypothetical protein
VLAAVDRLGYKGHVACEYRPRARTEDGLGWARAYGVVPQSNRKPNSPSHLPGAIIANAIAKAH